MTRSPPIIFCKALGYLDGDGFLDFYLGTGNPNYDSLVPNLMLLNDSGKRFVDVSMAVIKF